MNRQRKAGNRNSPTLERQCSETGQDRWRCSVRVSVILATATESRKFFAKVTAATLALEKLRRGEGDLREGDLRRRVCPQKKRKDTVQQQQGSKNKKQHITRKQEKRREKQRRRSIKVKEALSREEDVKRQLEDVQRMKEGLKRELEQYYGYKGELRGKKND